MKFSSTRNDKREVPFKETIFTGLAPDGGLYNPTTTPDLSGLIASFREDTPFPDLAAALTEALFPEEISRSTAYEICEKAFPFVPELNRIDDDIDILELFHGPSCAFKDFGASYLATVMEEFLKTEERRALILTATSGDTGSAVARAFYGKDMIDVVILYPSHRVSPLQEKQLTTVGGNVKTLEVKGSFDDCQKMVKTAFVDAELREKLPLTSANSINLGRLLPQSFYYVYAYSRLKPRYPHLRIAVPSGNFGNLTSGVLAWTWGMRVDGFIAATNINDVVPEYLQTNEYNPRPSIQTYSNAMDVGDPSNFERLIDIFGHDRQKMRSVLEYDVVTDEETFETIKKTYADKGMFLDPHTAVGYLASKRYLERFEKENHRKGPKPHLLTLSTAHPGKFLEIVEEATGRKVDLPEQLASVLSLKKQSIPVDNTPDALKEYLLDTYMN
jgi:threonine synthase